MRGWLFLIVLFIWGCSEPSVPDGYLKENEMALVLLDIYMAEGRLSFEESEWPSMEMFPIYKEKILEKHGLTDSVYNANMTFYITNPRFLDKAYEIVIDSMKLRRQALPAPL